MNRLVSLTHFQLGLIMSSIQLQHHQSPNSSIDSNLNIVHRVCATTIPSPKQFSFSSYLNQFQGPPPNPKAAATFHALLKEHSKNPKAITDGDFDSNAIPEVLLKKVKVLTCESTAPNGACKVYLVGTTHGNQISCRQVEEIINLLKPQAVFLERPPSCYGDLLTPDSNNPKGRACEFHVAYKEANKCGAKVFLGDRPYEMTFLRFATRMSLWEWMKYLYLSIRCRVSFIGFGEEELYENEKNHKVMLQSTPFGEVFVQERDQIMCYNLLKVASENSLVVAVVGRGHLEGMQHYWKQSTKVEDLMTIPPLLPTAVAYLIPFEFLTMLGIITITVVGRTFLMRMRARLNMKLRNSK